MFGLAKETGWSEHFILWELPFVRAMQYYHALLWASGQWTVKPVDEAEIQSSLEDAFNRLQSKNYNIEDEDV